MIESGSHFIATSLITVATDRQRQHFDEEALQDLALSIRDRGLIHPIILDREHNLVAGERRLRAHEILGFDQIEYRYADTLDPYELSLIELEENVRRSDLTWQEQVSAIAKFHKVKATSEPEWTLEKTGEELNMSRKKVTHALLVQEAIDEGVTEVSSSPQYSSALNFAIRRKERAAKKADRDIDSTLDAVIGIKPAEPVRPSSPQIETKVENLTDQPPTAEIINIDFAAWLPHAEPVFNFIHCDFPYGVKATKQGQSSAKHLGGYDDDPEIYWNLLSLFCENTEAFCADQTHLMFWFHMGYYEETKKQLESAGWVVNPFPLIWGKTCGKGIIPDAQRGPRRTYETAFLASRGDRKVVRAVNNFAAYPTTKDYHMSEKPFDMLKHFFRMFVDSSTVLLDPTAGSGMAVKVADHLGAEYSLGLEMDEDFAERAMQNLSS